MGARGRVSFARRPAFGRPRAPPPTPSRVVGGRPRAASSTKKRLRVARMGLDGGTTATRADILRGSSWELNAADASTSTRGGHVRDGASSARAREREVDSVASRRARWTSCALTGRRLSASRGVVACRRGRLYDKEAALEFVLARRGAYASENQVYSFANVTNDARKARATAHLRKRKDFFDVRAAASGGGSEDDGFAPECPVLGLVADGRTKEKFIAARPCGCIVSKRAVDAVGAAALDACLACGDAVVETTPLFPDDDDTDDDTDDKDEHTDQIPCLDRSRSSKRPRLACDAA